MKILITGGAGFVGSSLAKAYREKFPKAQIVAADNLKRRGSEINLAAFKRLGIDFHYCDIRNPNDLADLPGEFDLFIEASAEPSVLAGLDGSPSYVLETNLVGTLNCLELARKRAGAMAFLSTSRIYSIDPLKQIKLIEAPTRFEISDDQNQIGISKHGVAENFANHLPRSLYGATKLASELLIQEYVYTYGLKAVINRCGVIAGPGQFGKVDQGVFTLWMANHYFKKSLKYTGFGGTGKQVRDLLHPRDLFAALSLQFDGIDRFSGEIFNLGGGREISTSLNELTRLCQKLSGNEINITPDLKTSSVDIPLYLSDCTKASDRLGWKPAVSTENIFNEIFQWFKNNERELAPLFL